MKRNFLIVLILGTLLPVAAFSQQGAKGSASEMCKDGMGQIWMSGDSGYSDCVDEARGGPRDEVRGSQSSTGRNSEDRGSTGRRGTEPGQQSGKAGQKGGMSDSKGQSDQGKKGPDDGGSSSGSRR